MKSSFQQTIVVLLQVAFTTIFLTAATTLLAAAPKQQLALALRTNQASRGAVTRAAALRPPDEVGPHSRIWAFDSADSHSRGARRPGSVSTADSDARWQNRPRRRVVEMASGMNYWNGQEWTPSEASFELRTDVFVAERVQHKVRLADNLNVSGAVTVVTPDGITLRSTPVGIGLYDAASGQSLILAAIGDCSGILVSSNEVVYENAFNENGVRADVVYRIQRGSFEQDVVIRSRLDVADYGFPANSTRIQIFTEFYDVAQPDRIRRPLRVEQDQKVRNRMVSPDLVDELLGFGEFVIATGQASLVKVDSATGEAAVPVAKQFTNIQGRTFLIESVECGSLDRELRSLPNITPKNASMQPMQGIKKAKNGYASIPSPRSYGQAKAATNRTSTRMARADDIRRPSVVIDYLATIGGDLAGTIVFQGDTTYFVSGPVNCNGATTIEGGAVFKYPNSTGTTPTPVTAYIKLNNPLTCRTSDHRPAIFTAADDENIGESLWETWSGWTGDPTGKHYANPALWVHFLSSTTLSNLRFNYAQEAVLVWGSSGSSTTVSHAQLVNCIRGIKITGSGTGCGITVTVNNSLFSGVVYPLTANSLGSANLYHCTIDTSTVLVSATSSSSFSFINSILANITTLSTGNPSVSGNYNGFYLAPQFGSNRQFETENPFAPTSFIDPNDGQEYLFFANGQGAYYLREESPFFGVGTTNIPASLKNELAQRTTIPPTVFSDDLISARALSQRLIRDTDTPELGYHYPTVDYAINGATVNSCTLNIDQGTVLGLFGGNWEWGIRLNPGGRLNVNGVPTNRVVFAHLEAVQENPTWQLQPWGPLITFKGVYFESGSAKPLAEARIRYGDFPTVSEDNWNVHFGNLESFTDISYMEVGNLNLDGCLFQGGAFLYMAGGMQSRTLSIRNNIFERTDVFFKKWVGTYEEQLTVANNLFYNDFMVLWPVSGDNWTFIDNIFDRVTFAEDEFGTLFNGPVAVNHHNAYVGMGQRLSPAAPTSTDPDLASLTYLTGSLGRFYLPTSATSLIDKGSRLAADAGLYHLTSFTSNVKEGNEAPNPKQVNIGPHNLALVSAKPADFDGDGIPDVIEDENGNGIADGNESPWNTLNAGNLVILEPVPNSTVGGILRLRFRLGDNAGSVMTLTPFVDGTPALSFSGLDYPAKSLGQIEIDTTRVQNGQHVLNIQAEVSSPDDSPQYIYSDPITVTVANDIRMPTWHEIAQQTFDIQMEVPSALPSYSVSFYDSTYPKANNPQPIYIASGTATGGQLSFSEDPWAMGYGDGDTDPYLYSFVELSATPTSTPSTAFPTPPARQPPPFPPVGNWVVGYDDDVSDYEARYLEPIKDPLTVVAGQTKRWHHGVQLDGWFQNGVDAGGVTRARTAAQNPTKMAGQTYPLRFVDTFLNMTQKDMEQLLWFLFSKDTWNFYGFGHGNPSKFMGISAGDFKNWTNAKRFRFVFLDGCQTFSGALLTAFGADDREIARELLRPDYDNTLKKRPGAFLSWSVDVPRGFKVVPAEWDETTQKTCNYKHLTSRCNWHMQLLFFWKEMHKTLKEAIVEANKTYKVSFENNEPDIYDRYVKIIDAAGNPIQERFDPNIHLKYSGFKDLKFNDFNLGPQWPR